MALANAVNAHVQENEITMLSFGTTYDSLFLDSLAVISRKIEDNLSSLDHILVSNGLLENRLDSIRFLVQERMSYFLASINEYEGPEAYLDYIIENRKANYLRFGKRIRSLTDSIVEDQHELLGQQERGVFANLTALTIVLLVITAIGLATGWFNLLSLATYQRAQKESDQQIQAYQEKLKLQIDQLNQTNHELEQFAYVASHDLQEPLRKITAFNDLLQDQYKDTIEGEGKLYLDRMAHAAKRMRRLITDLLEYSRAGRLTADREPLDLNTLLEEVLDDLSLQIDEQYATIHRDPLPMIDGHYSDWRTVFQNLLSNALKFRKKDTSPIISIRCEKADSRLAKERVYHFDPDRNYYHLQVTDNGIGFNTDYSDKIFTIFQRLHGKDEYEGTGIGLAICKKIVERYDGVIYANSEPGKGTTFHLLFAGT
ncbi:phytochrome [Lunatimonas lonarensis]|uniref:histidine kinase n=2 Tax=Lunatimonas lonarensis TaxID=1232681 RepID=R7ZMB9_9BACT|nr:phytochrome [Lunatimonas lonarensis]